MHLQSISLQTDLRMSEFDPTQLSLEQKARSWHLRRQLACSHSYRLSPQLPSLCLETWKRPPHFPQSAQDTLELQYVENWGIAWLHGTTFFNRNKPGQGTKPVQIACPGAIPMHRTANESVAPSHVTTTFSLTLPVIPFSWLLFGISFLGHDTAVE